MKRIGMMLLVLLLAGLCGCGLVGNTYVSVQPHNSQRTDQTDSTVVENYVDLKNALVEQINQHATRISMITYSYAGDVETDLEKGVAYLQEEYPLGAYAIENVTYDLAQVASFYQIKMEVTYHYTAEELKAIQHVSMDQLEQTIGQALTQGQTKQVLWISSYEDTDFTALCGNYVVQHPEKVMQMPEVTAELWPQEGSARIVSLHYQYSYSQEELNQMQVQVTEVLSTADGYVSYASTEAEAVQLLFSFLSQRFTYRVQSTDTPAYSMLCQGVADSQIYAQIFRLLCQWGGIGCQVVDGLKNGAPYHWLIVKVDGTYRHADPFAAELEGRQQLQFFSDAQMTAYTWETENYPSCPEDSAQTE